MIDRIWHEDCLVGMDRLPTGSVDMILTDLPYGMTGCAWDSILPMEKLWAQYKRVIKPNGAIVLTAAQPFTTKLIASNLKQFRYCWYWHKNMVTGYPFAKIQPMRCVEDIAVFYAKRPTYNPQGLVEKAEQIKIRAKPTGVYRSGLTKAHVTQYTNYPRNLLQIPCERTGAHPTQKPVALFEYLIRTYTQPGELVLDSCMGSGTTALACIQSGRHYVGFETDRGYWDTAQQRIADLRGQ